MYSKYISTEPLLREQQLLVPVPACVYTTLLHRHSAMEESGLLDAGLPSATVEASGAERTKALWNCLSCDFRPPSPLARV